MYRIYKGTHQFDRLLERPTVKQTRGKTDVNVCDYYRYIDKQITNDLEIIKRTIIFILM